MAPSPMRSPQPSWRDIYDLSRELRDELVAHRLEERESHERIEVRLAALEQGQSFKQGQKAGEQRVLGFGKTSLTIALSISSAIVAAISALMAHIPV